MTIFLMFFIELMAARFDLFGAHEHDLESAKPATDPTGYTEKQNDEFVSKSMYYHSPALPSDLGPFFTSLLYARFRQLSSVCIPRSTLETNQLLTGHCF